MLIVHAFFSSTKSNNFFSGNYFVIAGEILIDVSLHYISFIIIQLLFLRHRIIPELYEHRQSSKVFIYVQQIHFEYYRLLQISSNTYNSLICESHFTYNYLNDI